MQKEISVRLSEIYGVPEEQVLLTYGGEDILKNAIHYYLMKGDNKKILIPEFSWWYYNKVASECYGTFEMADADYGYVGACPGKISLYRRKECVEKNIPEEGAVDKLLEFIRKSQA